MSVPVECRKYLIEAIVKLRVRDWRMYQKQRANDHLNDESKLQAATTAVIERFTTGIFAEQSSDPTSDFVLSMIEGEIEVQLLQDTVLASLACCRHVGLAPKNAFIAVQFTRASGGRSGSQITVLDVSKAFVFAKVFAFGTMEHVRVSDDGERLLRIFAQENGCPEVRYGFGSAGGNGSEMVPMTETLPQGWGL